MALKFASNLSRNRYGVLHFRLAIPPDLRSHFAVKEIYRSLNTASVKDAALQAQALSMAFKRAFVEIRQQSMTSIKKPLKTPLYDTSDIGVGLVMEYHPDGGLKTFQLDPHDSQKTIDAAFATVERMNKARSSAPAPATKAAPLPSKHIAEYVTPYLDYQAAQQKQLGKDTLSTKTSDSYRAAIESFIEIVGNKPLLELTIHDQNRFEDIVFRLPTNRNKMSVTCGLTIDQILELDTTNLKLLSLQTAKNYAQRTNNFLSWAFRREGSKPPFELLDQVKSTKKRKAADKRRAFTPEELRIVFNPATLGKSVQASPYMFWLPLIAVHTGMRINEIAQLDLADFVTNSGISCFSVTDEPDKEEEPELFAKRLKNEASKRGSL
jgi:hypothetical protein